MTRKTTNIVLKILLGLLLALILLSIIGLNILRPEIDARLDHNIEPEQLSLGYLHGLPQEDLLWLCKEDLAGSVNDFFDLVKETENLRSKTENLLAIREADYQDYRCECDGTCGTGKVGRGTECDRKEKKYLQSNQTYQDHKILLDSMETSLDLQQEQLENDIEQMPFPETDASVFKRLQVMWEII